MSLFSLAKFFKICNALYRQSVQSSTSGVMSRDKNKTAVSNFISALNEVRNSADDTESDPKSMCDIHESRQRHMQSRHQLTFGYYEAITLGQIIRLQTYFTEINL